MTYREWTRRQFVATGSTAAALITAIQPLSAAVFTAAEREILVAAMDEIIPAADGMPAASQVGCFTYLESIVPEIEGLADEFHALLTRLRNANPPLVRTLRSLEQEEPELFATFRDYVYEAYYTRAEVWDHIGYTPYLTHQRGPEMKPFDASVLDRVRRLERLYVEVD